MERKHTPTEILKIDEDDGHVEAWFSTFDVIDKDGDVTEAGFFGEQTAILAWSHDWAEPLGPGSIHEDTRTKDGASTAKGGVFVGDFLMDVPSIRDRFLTVKGMGKLQEWSYGFNIRKGGWRMDTFKGEDVRVLQPLEDGSPGSDVHEVSPVLVGAGEGTQTLALKGIEGMPFTDHLSSVVAEVAKVVDRAEEVKALRAEKGKELGAEALLELGLIENECKRLIDRITALTPPVDEADIDQLRAEFARFQGTEFRLANLG